ncbi:Avt1p [Sporobolomyces salmoneus]|uniref:Avt1p n=1 Tax=Sporobolomyces salmoneus TaxID=183962 RepID=UPI003174A994
MTSRRIPISRTQSHSAQRPAPDPSTTTPFRSSLDLVFSFSRSAGFFGENLPSGPSFVDRERYRPPNYDDDETEESEGGEGEAEARGSSSHERETTGGTESEEYEAEEGESYTNGLGGEVPNWAPGEEEETSSSSAERGLNARAEAEQLPRNAKRNQPHPAVPTRSILSSSPGGSSLNDFLTSPPRTSSELSLPLHATFNDLEGQERSPLLSTRRRSSQGQNQRPKSYGSLLENPSQLEWGHYLDINGNGLEEAPRKRLRRPSTFSKEAWKAAIEEHRGESTWFQSLFNTVNVLVGVGLLAEPLAFAYGGWILGTVLLLFCALVTNYTAKMLASLMRLDPTQHTYADVLIKAFGPRSRQWIYALFVIELGTFSVAAIELFADSLNSLFPKVSSMVFKAMSYFILVPTTFLPLRLLSLTSLLGILSSIVLLSVIIADGTLKTEAPGSLWDPMKTSWGPNWKKLPICFGLMMSGFSGHAVVPSLYRDMKNPQHFSSMINVAYIIAFSVSIIFAILGYLMFGNGVSSEITKDLSRTSGYPVALTKVAVWMVAINPLVKYAVANKPLVTTFEHLIGLHPQVPPQPPSLAAARKPSSSSLSVRPGLTSAISTTSSSRSELLSARPSRSSLSLASHHQKERRIQLIRYWVLRPVLSILFVLVAIAIPDFDRVLSFLGSSSAFVICCIGPIGAYLRLSTTPRHGSKEEEDRETGERKRNGGSTTTRGIETRRRHGGGGGGSSGKTSIDTITQPQHNGAVDSPSTSSAANLNGIAEISQELLQPTQSSLSNAQLHWLDSAKHSVEQGERLVIGRGERWLCWSLLVTSIAMAVVGTVWSFLPEF